MNFENAISHFVLDRSKEELSTEEIEYLDTLSDREVQQIIDYLEQQYNYYNAFQNGQKLVLNSIYGAFGNQFFVCSTKEIANSITLMARLTIKMTDKINENYWYNEWHNDTEMHEKLGITKVKPIPQDWIHLETGMDWKGEVKYEDVENGIYQRKYPVSNYIDTDSVDKDTVIRTNKGILTIEDLYNYSEQFGSNGVTSAGHESVKTDVKVLNWSENNKLYYGNVKRIIKHKVNKTKWKLKTKSGKNIIVTNDHSLIVFRNNKKIEVKPEEVLKTDKVLVIKTI